MSTIPLQILLHGLIALVPMNDADGAAHHMTALLVDARTAPDEMSATEKLCFVRHEPALKMTLKDSALCAPAGCEPDGGLCICKLDRQNATLWIDPPLDIEKSKLDKKPQHAIPFKKEGADDFSYIANLTQQGWELDRRFLDAAPPSALIARMEFPFAKAKACSLGVRPDEGGRNVHPLSFRPHGALEEAGNYSQALAQQALALLDIPEDATVTVTLRKFGEPGPGRDLVLKPGVHGYSIELTNMRSPDSLNTDHPCDDGVGRDFAFFYELVKDKPAWKVRPIPHIKYTRWKSASDLEGGDCESHPVHVASSRPICAMASFN